MKSTEIIRELNRISGVLNEAEITGKILVDTSCGNDLDPYPIFFTAEELMAEINKGNWHYVTWYLEDKEVMKKQILARINTLQERLIRL